MNDDESTLNLSELICEYMGCEIEVYGDDCCGQHYIVSNEHFSIQVGPYSIELTGGIITGNKAMTIRGMARRFDRSAFLTESEL